MTARPRALLIIAHCFHPEGIGKHGPAEEQARPQRRAALERVLLAWRGLFGPSREPDWNSRTFRVEPAGVADIDILILVHGEHHLLDDALLQRFGASIMAVAVDEPKLLPFGAHAVIKRNIGSYDWFIYSEDDVVPVDAGLFRKQALFQKAFGPHRLLQPNRFAMDPARSTGKTYVDGELPPPLVEQLWRHRDGAESALSLDSDLGTITFARARNPHAGFFMLSDAQAAHWVAQDHFLDLDCSLVSPLESAASLSLLKTMPLYKPASDTRWFLEVEHADDRFALLGWPEQAAGS